MTYAAEGNRNTAERIVRAHRDFAAQLIEIAGCTETQAREVTTLYLRAKVAKLDPIGGRITVKHGAFLDCRAVLNAIKITATNAAN